MQACDPGASETPRPTCDSNAGAPSPASGVVSRFNRFLSMLAALPAAEEIFTPAAQELVDLLDARFVAITTYRPTENVLVCRAFNCSRTLDPSMPMILGTNHIGYVTPSVPEQIRAKLLGGRLHCVQGGVFDLLVGGVPLEACRQAEQAMAIADCYAVGMTWQGALVGTIVMGMAAGVVVDAALVEACARQVAVLYRQRESERLLIETNEFLEERVRQRTAQLERSNWKLLTEISERRKIERNLRASQAHLQAIFENVEDSIWSVDANYCLRFGNPVFQRMMESAFGRSLQPGESVLDLGMPADACAEWKGYYDRALAGEHVIVERPGQFLPSRMMEFRFGPIRSDDEHVVGVIAFGRDITGQWQDKEALRKSEEKYRRLFDNAQVGMFRTRLDGSEVLEINDRLAQMVQKSKAEVVGKPSILNWAVPEKRDELLRALQESGHVVAFEMPMIVGDGSVHTLLLSITTYPEENLLEGTAADITERKQIEDALRESERRLASLMHNLPGMAYRCRNDEFWTMEFVSEGVEALTGYTADDLLRNRKISFADVIDPLDRMFVWETVQANVANRRPYQISYRIRTARGEQRWVWEQGAAVYDDDGSAIALEGFITDITELKAAQEEIQASELRFRSLFEASRVGTAIVSLDGKILQANSALAQFLGYDRAQLIGKSIADVSHPDDFATDAQMIELLLAGELPWYTIEKRYVTQGGELSWGLLTASLVRDLSGAPQFMIGQVQDINERKAVQTELEQLYRRSRLDAQEKSVLLNEINHRVKNNLLAILGLLLAEQRFAPPEVRPLLEEYFERVAMRVKGLMEVHRLLSEREWAPPEVSELISHLIHAALTAHSLTAQVSVDVTPSPIRVTPRQASNLTIVINELLANSLKHALPGRPMLHVRVAVTAFDDRIQIEYCDNGDGYPAAVLEQKQQGVGLYLMRRIVERTLRGNLVMRNDNGAVTQISLPVDVT